MKHPLEGLFCGLEIRVARRHIVQAQFCEFGEERQVRIQMSLEAVHTFKSRIDETKGHHRGKRKRWVIEHGEFIHEVAVGRLIFDRSRVAFVGQDFLVDSHLVAEENQLLLFGFQIRELLVSQNEVESNEPGSDVFGRVNLSETDIFPSNRLIEMV